MIRTMSILALAAVAGCGDPAPADVDAGDVEDCATPAAERLLPLAVGASWTYDVTDLVEEGSPTVEKVNEVEALEDVGDRKAGVTAYRVRTEKLDGTTVSWQEDLCTSIVRHREQTLDEAGALVSDQFFVPSKLRVDESAEHLVEAASWSVTYVELELDPIEGDHTVSKEESWTVEATAEEVTVPAGTFTAVRLRKVTSGDADKQFWFAAGVGKIKEEGEQREELRAYTLP